MKFLFSPRLLRAWAFIGAVAWMLAGCCADDDDPAWGEVWVDLGEQRPGGDWAPLTDGQPLRIIAGLQGGYHVELVTRWRALESEGLALRYQVWEVERAQTINWPTRYLVSARSVTCDPQRRCGRGVDIVQLDGWQPELFDGLTVDVEVTVERSPSERYTVRRRARLVY
jgi:hypothetical protein